MRFSVFFLLRVTGRDVTEECVLECAPNFFSLQEEDVFCFVPANFECLELINVLFDAHFAHVVEHLINILRVDFLLIC